MLIENERQLRNWLEYRLEPICDADPVALAKYVLALTKKDKQLNDLKSLCNDQLDVFLQSETTPFVEDLFTQLESKSYLKFDLQSIKNEKLRQEALKVEVLAQKPVEQDGLKATSIESCPIEPEKPIASPSSSKSDGDHLQRNQLDVEADLEDGEIDKKQQQPTANKISSEKSTKKHKSSNLEAYKEIESKSLKRERRSRSKSPPAKSSRHDHSSSKRERSRDHSSSIEKSREPEQNVSSSFRDDRRRHNIEKIGRDKEKEREKRERELLRERQALKDRERRKDRDHINHLDLIRSRDRRDEKRLQEHVNEDVEYIRRKRKENERDEEKRREERTRKQDSTAVVLRSRSRSPPEIKRKIVKEKAPKKKEACPDFYEKGICTRGDKCKYEHTGAIVTIDNDRANGSEETKIKSPVVTTTMPAPVSHPMSLPTPGSLPMPGSLYDPTMPQLTGLPPVPVPPPSGDAHAIPSVSQVASAMGLTQVQIQQSLNAIANAAVQQHFPGSSDQLLAQRGSYHSARGGYHRGSSHSHGSVPSGRTPPGEIDPLKIHLSNMPENLNNITKLNEHFSKFGEITNIQVSSERKTSSVEFSSDAACRAALTSPDPVFNNRFIQIRQFVNRPIYPTRGGFRGRGTTFRGRGAPSQPHIPVHERLGRNNAEVKAVAIKQAENEPAPAPIETEEQKLLKQKAKDRILAAKANRKKREANQMVNAKKAKMNLLNQQRELLEKQIIQQKRLVEKLQDPATGMLEKPSLLQTLKSLASNTDEMRSRVKILESEIYEDEKRSNVEKEIAETEKVLHIAGTTGQDTQELRLKMYRLQDEAAKLGVYTKQRAQKAAQLKAMRIGARGRGGLSMRGRGRGRGGVLAISQKMAQRSNEFMAAGAIVDRRPRKLRVTNYTDDEIDEVIIHLSEVGDVEYLDEIEDGICILVQYKTRADAELASTKGAFFKNKKLIIVWQKSDDDADFLTGGNENNENIENTENSHSHTDLEEELRTMDDELLADKLGQTGVSATDQILEKDDLDDSTEDDAENESSGVIQTVETRPSNDDDANDLSLLEPDSSLDKSGESFGQEDTSKNGNQNGNVNRSISDNDDLLLDGKEQEITLGAGAREAANKIFENKANDDDLLYSDDEIKAGVEVGNKSGEIKEGHSGGNDKLQDDQLLDE